MNAVVSGQAGVALLIDGEQLSSFHAGRPAEITRRSAAQVPLLFGDAKDLQFLEAVELEEVRGRLERASDQVDSLHLTLILLDESLSHDTRRTAAEDLEELLAVEGNRPFVENVLYAHPLPRGADLAGARAVCPGTANLTRHFLEKLASLQGVIAEVYFAWEQIPEELFDRKRDRSKAQSIAVREGFFRDLVALRAVESVVDSFLRTALLNKPFRRVHNRREILHAWMGPLRSQATEPERDEVSLHAATVAEDTPIERLKLKLLVDIFPTHDFRFKLTLSLEPEEDYGSMGRSKAEMARLLKAYIDAGLVKPTIPDEQLYWTARRSHTVELTPRGKEYWWLVKQGKI